MKLSLYPCPFFEEVLLQLAFANKKILLKFQRDEIIFKKEL